MKARKLITKELKEELDRIAAKVNEINDQLKSIEKRVTGIQDQLTNIEGKLPTKQKA